MRHEATGGSEAVERRTDADELAPEPVVAMLKIIFDDDPRIPGCTNDVAEGLVQMANTIDLRKEVEVVSQTGEDCAENFELGRNIAGMRCNRYSFDKMAAILSLEPEVLHEHLWAYMQRLQAVPGAEKREYLDDFFANPAPWRLGMAGFDDPEMSRQLVWPYATLNVDPSCGAKKVRARFGLEGGETIKIQPIPGEWSTPRSQIPELWAKLQPNYALPQYVKITNDDTLRHPDFPDGIVLDAAAMGLLNMFLKTEPNTGLTSRDLVEAWPIEKSHSSDQFVDALALLREHHIILGVKGHPDAVGPIFMLNPIIVFMEKRPEYMEHVEYATELERLVAKTREDLLYHGYVYFSDDTVLGLGDELTSALEAIFNSDTVRRHEFDVPATRKRADERLNLQMRTDDSQPSIPANDMPRWTIGIRGGEIIFQEAVSNRVPPSIGTVKRRPTELSRFWVSEHPALQKLAAVIGMICADRSGGETVMTAHCFRTDGVVVEKDHHDGARFAVLRCAGRDGDGAYTQLKRRYPELSPRATFSSQPYVSTKIPVKGLKVWDDRRFKHYATYLYPPE